jgi:branched-chain amino acid transport system permease protein
MPAVVVTEGDVVNLLFLVLMTYSLALPLRMGLLSIAPVGFAGLSAYATGLLQLKLHWGFPTAAIGAVLFCAAISALLAVPLGRIRGLYTSIATLAFLVICTSLENSLAITGGPFGLVGVPHIDLRWPAVAGVILVLAGFYWLDHSRVGRTLDLIGHDAILASTLGARIGTYRAVTIIVSGVMAAAAGSVYAASFYVVDPSAFNFYASITMVAFAVVGGSSFWAGPLLGTLLLGSLAVFLRGLTDWEQIIAGLTMVATIVLYPDGIGGALRRGLRFRRKVEGSLKTAD